MVYKHGTEISAILDVVSNSAFWKALSEAPLNHTYTKEVHFALQTGTTCLLKTSLHKKAACIESSTF